MTTAVVAVVIGLLIVAVIVIRSEEHTSEL